MTGVAARSDYAANAGDTTFAANDIQGEEAPLYKAVPTYTVGDAMPDSSWATYPGGANGSTGQIFLRSECTSAAIKDGAAYNYLLGERFLTTDYYYGGSLCDDDQSWDIGFDYDTNRWTRYPPQRDSTLKAGQNSGDCMEMFGSAHPAGFHMAFCDGSVRKMNYSFVATLHKQLGNIADGQPTQLQQVDAASN
jgi:prepilin-type processing-associated H-X9-DG protein